MNTILVPLDFSDCAPRVLAEAIRFARAFGAKLILLHASEGPRGMPTSSVMCANGGPSRTLLEVLRDDTLTLMAPMVATARAQQVEAVARAELGRVPEVILDVASREGVSMIVMGTHGRTGLARLALGSVAEEVLRHADVPVVTMRTQHHDGCAARSCAHCGLGRSDAEERVAAEETG